MTTKPSEAPEVDKFSQIQGTLSTLSVNVTEMLRRLGDVETRVRQQDMRTAKFQPIQAPQAAGKPKPRLEDLHTNGQYASNGQSLAVSASGLLAPYARVVYPAGAIVRVNPESDLYKRLAAYRSQRGKGFDPDTGEGTVITTHFVNSNFEVKYRVRFDGLTPPRGDGFYESELIPA